MDDTNVSALCVSVHASFLSHHVVLWNDYNPPEPRVRGNDTVELS